MGRGAPCPHSPEGFCWQHAVKNGREATGIQRWRCQKCQIRRQGERPPEYDPAETCVASPETPTETTTKDRAETVTVETPRREEAWTVEEVANRFGVDLAEYAADATRTTIWDGWERGADGVCWNAEQHAVRVTFKRRSPQERLLASLEPVRLPAPTPPTRPAPGRGVDTYVLLGDMQVGYRWVNGELQPYHDRRAIDVAIQVAEELQPTRIIQGGDILDAPEMSEKYRPDNDLRGTLNPAIRECAGIMHRLQTIAPTTALEGNHEERLRRSAVAGPFQGIERYDGVNVLSIDHLLGLSAMGIEYLEGGVRYHDNELYLTDSIRIIHGESSSSGAMKAARTEVRAHSVQFHGHRWMCEENTFRGRGGVEERWLAMQVPCLCQPRTLPKGRGFPNWQQGFVVIEVAGDIVTPTYIPIHDGVAVFRGRRFVGRDVSYAPA